MRKSGGARGIRGAAPEWSINKMRGILISLAFVLSSFGQITTGSLSGYVFDPSKRAIPNAKVMITDPARSFTRAAIADAAGFYRIADLPPASYKLAASASGFVTTLSPDVRLAVDQQARIDFTLPISGQEQSVTVRSLASA